MFQNSAITHKLIIVGILQNFWFNYVVKYFILLTEIKKAVEISTSGTSEQTNVFT